MDEQSIPTGDLPGMVFIDGYGRCDERTRAPIARTGGPAMSIARGKRRLGNGLAESVV
jgi:hypothetical protein